MTYGVARAATAPELALYRTPDKWSKLRAAVFPPSTVYTARINQTFADLDGVLELTYDTGSGTLGDILPDMTLLVGSTAGAHDIGICRIRSADGTKLYIGETSDVSFANDQYLTVINDFGLWAKHVLIDEGTTYMDGGTAYSDQHALPDPTPVMGSHRVLKLTGASVSAEFDGSDSYVVGALSSISAYAWTAPGSSSSSGMTTATPTISWNAVGWYPVYLTVTAANAKTFFGVRYVYVWNDANLPPRARIESCRGDVDSGGWSAELTLFDDCDLTAIRDRALVVLFAEDYFGATQQSIGPVAGSENILFTGWIATESITWHPEQGSVRFTAYGAAYWLSQIPSFPDGVEFTTATPAAWTEFQNLTVDKGLWHMLHWRTTATRVMDVFLTGDTKYTAEVSSLATSLWEQVREMGFLQIYARALVNAQNQLYIEVHPQLVPVASRTWPTVMTITTEDWQGEIAFERVVKPEVAVVSLSGVAVNESGVGAAYFSLSPGHAYPRYGSIDVQDKLLVASQAQANGLAGLYRGWRNNPYPEIPITLAADVRLIDICPRQVCAIALATGDTPRGIAYTGDLVPAAVSVVTDPDTGALHREVVFEAETVQDLAVNGDIPGGRADPSIPPTPGLPRLPAFPVILPGTIEPSTDGPVRVLLHDTSVGLLYCENFDASSPTWRTVNAGLTGLAYTSANWMAVCPNGAVYLSYIPLSDPGTTYFLARAPSIGGTFVEQTIASRIRGAAINPLVPETICFWAGATGTRIIYVGADDSFDTGVTLADFGGGGASPDCMSYGFGYWLLTRFSGYARIAPDGGSVAASGTPNLEPTHLRAGTLATIYSKLNGGDGVRKSIDNCATVTTVSTGSSIIFAPTSSPISVACDPTGTYLMGRGLGANKARSSDGGATWVAIPNLPAGNWYYAYAGGAGVSSRWIAVSGTQIKYSTNFGDSWVDKLGNMLSVSPTPNPRMIRVVEF